ncbi:MAG TPA: hypothetical protein PKL35_07280, partial [Methanoregulaceae archaeon]|nr:hypothetical protein [Methanoregulaceae archaeon]
ETVPEPVDDAVFQMQEKPSRINSSSLSLIFPPHFIELVIAEPDQPRPMTLPVPLTRVHLYNGRNFG